MTHEEIKRPRSSYFHYSHLFSKSTDCAVTSMIMRSVNCGLFQVQKTVFLPGRLFGLQLSAGDNSSIASKTNGQRSNARRVNIWNLRTLVSRIVHPYNWDILEEL